MNERVPTLLTPVAGELATVAPVNAQVCVVTGQLSDAVGLGVVTLAAQVPGVLDTIIGAGQVIVGACVSFTVTVNEQEGVSALSGSIANPVNNVPVIFPINVTAPV